MSDIIPVQHDDASRAMYPPYSSNHNSDGRLDSTQALTAHLFGVFSGALIILGTTVAVCAVVRLL